MIFYAPGIGYQDYIQVLPSFNNYFGQRVINFGFRNGYLRNPSGPGTCESSYFWPLAICVTEKLKQQLPNEHFIDNCNPGYKTYPWYKHPFGGCQCVCFPEWL